MADLDERLDASAEQPSEEPQDSAPDATTQDESAQADTTEADATQTDEAGQSEDVTEVDDGTQLWITTEGSEVGYRVSEVLFGIDTEGVGRTEDARWTLYRHNHDRSRVHCRCCIDEKRRRSKRWPVQGPYYGAINISNGVIHTHSSTTLASPQPKVQR